MSACRSWLEEWELLGELVEPLTAGPARTLARAWALGPPEDGVALAVAVACRQGGGPGADATRVYVTDPGVPVERLSFRRADIRGLPSNGIEAAFVRRDRRWVPREPITRSVVMHSPVAPVDVAAVRTGARTGPPDWARFRPALTRLRGCGRVLFDVVPPTSLVREWHLQRVGPSGRLFEKVPSAGDLRADAAAGPARATTPDTPGGRPDSPDDDSRDTLAHRLQAAALVDSHMGLARNLARRFTPYGDIEDLEQVAMMALVRASLRYRADTGFAFATYATASIVGELKRHFRDRSWAMRVPRPVQETYLAVRAARDELAQKLGRSPTVDQIAAHLGTTEESVLMAMEAGQNYSVLSLDIPSPDGDGARFEPAAEDSGLDLALDRHQLRLALPGLDATEQRILRRLYFDGVTQKQLAAELGVSQMQVSRLAARLMGKLRQECAATD